MKNLFWMLALSCSFAPLVAKSLPTVGRYPWYKTYHGYELKKMDVVLATDGSVIIFPKIEKKRMGVSHVVTTKVLIEYQKKGGKKWTRRNINSSGFEFTKPPGLNQGEVLITGSVTGGVQFELKLKHDKKGVVLCARFVKKPDYTKANYRLSLISEMQDIYGISGRVKRSTVSEKVRGDGISLDPVDDEHVKKRRFKLNSAINVRPYQTAGIKSIELKAKRYGRNEFLWSLQDSRNGSLDLRLKNTNAGAHKGFYVENVLVDKHGDTRSRGMRIEFH